jgi:hypothetical protein
VAPFHYATKSPTPLSSGHAGVTQGMKKITYWYHPGFSPDLTTWKVTLTDTGKLYQEVDIENYNTGERGNETFRKRIEKEKFDALWNSLNQIDFEQINLETHSYAIDDAAMICVATTEQENERKLELADIEVSYFKSYLTEESSRHYFVFLKIFDELLDLAPWQDKRLIG